jgi:putative salt-induced outer membrane protein YdiY
MLRSTSWFSIPSAALVLLLGSATLAQADVVTLKNGDRISGTIEVMTDGKLVVATPWGDKAVINWSEVAEVKTDAALPLKLEDGTIIQGAIDPGEAPGVIRVRSESVLDAPRIELDKVTAVNPPKEKPIKYTGNITAGANIRGGNTRTTNGNANAEFVARAKRLRLTLKGAWNYTEDRAIDEITARSAYGSIKLDFFATEKLYTYAQASFLGDKFRDFNLRSTFGAGLGYQWVEEDHLHFSTEAGVSYVVEDRIENEDTRQVAARIAWDFLWDISIDQVTFFHNGEFYPSLERAKDFFVYTQTGMRFTIWKGFFASAQVNYQFEGQPSDGFRHHDVQYIFGLGYGFTL